MGYFSKRVLVFGLTYVGYSVIYSTRKPFSVVKSIIQIDQGLDTYQLGVIDSSFLVSYALGQMLLPPLTFSRASPSTILVISFLASSIVSAFFGLSSTGGQMAFLSALNGIAHSVCFPCMIRLLAPLFPSASRGKWLCAWTTSQQVGAMSSTGMAAYLSGKFGWRSAFQYPAVLVAALALMFHCFLGPEETPSQDTVPNIAGIEMKAIGSPTTNDTSVTVSQTDQLQQNTRDRKPRTLESGVDGVASDISTNASSASATDFIVPVSSSSVIIPSADNEVGNSLREVWRLPGIRSVACAYFCVKCVRYSLLFWLPYFLTTRLLMDPTAAGYASMAFDIGGMFGALLTGLASDTIFGGRRFFWAAIMCTMSCISLLNLSLGTSGTQHAAIAAMLLVGFAIAGPDSILGASAPQDLCDRAGKGTVVMGSAAGLINGFGGVGAALQGWLTAAVSERFGWSVLFMVLAAFSLLGSLLLVSPAITENSATKSAMKINVIQDEPVHKKDLDTSV